MVYGLGLMFDILFDEGTDDQVLGMKFEDSSSW